MSSDDEKDMLVRELGETNVEENGELSLKGKYRLLDDEGKMEETPGGRSDGIITLERKSELAFAVGDEPKLLGQLKVDEEATLAIKTTSSAAVVTLLTTAKLTIRGFGMFLTTPNTHTIKIKHAVRDGKFAGVTVNSFVATELTQNGRKRAEEDEEEWTIDYGESETVMTRNNQLQPSSSTTMRIDGSKTTNTGVRTEDPPNPSLTSNAMSSTMCGVVLLIVTQIAMFV